MTNKEGIFDTEWLNENGTRLRYRRKTPYFTYEQKPLEKYLNNLTVDELKQLESNIKSAANKVQKINDDLQSIVNKGFHLVYEYNKKKEEIDREVLEIFPDPVKIFFIPTEDIKEVRNKRDKHRLLLLKNLSWLEIDIHKAYQEVIEKVKLQFQEFDKLIPELKENVFWRTYDDERYLPAISIDDYPQGWSPGHGQDYRHLGLELNFSSYKAILDHLPKIISYKTKKESAVKVRKKRQERSATLAAYEDKSRNVGKSIMAKMKADIKAPYHCPYCKKKTPKTKIHVDHINPISNGGLSVERNLVPVCADCNLQKRDLSLRAFSRKSKLDFESICDTLESMGKFI
jgi:5-methylcytosine-specific restriction endonuclease McrA